MKIKSADLFFFLGWIIFLISYTFCIESELMFITDVSNIYKICKIIFISLFAFKILFIDKYSFKKLLLYLLILGLSFIGSLKIGSDTVFLAFLIALSADKIEFSKFAKVDIILRLSLLLLIIVLCLSGCFPNFTKEINGSFKQGFGFSHPNILGLNATIILLEYMYLNKKIDFKYILINIISIALIIYFCNARTSVYSFVIIFLSYVFIKNKEKIFNKKVLKSLIIILPIIMLLLSFVLIKGYDNHNSFMIELDRVFTTRLSWGSKYYHQYGINMFGNQIETIGTRKALLTGKQSKILDMGYLRLAINNGVIVCTIFVSLLMVFLKNILKSKDYNLLLVSLFFIIIGLLENNVYNIAFNWTLIAFINLYRKGVKNE